MWSFECRTRFWPGDLPSIAQRWRRCSVASRPKPTRPYANFPVQVPLQRLQGARFRGAEDETTDHDVFVPVNCPVCAQVHLVDPKTRKVLGADDSEASDVA
jgi:hypothetical protein